MTNNLSTTPKTSSPSDIKKSISSKWTSAISSFLMDVAQQKFDLMVLAFSDALSKECGIEREKICEVWNQIAPDCAIDLKTALEREVKKKNTERKKAEGRKKPSEGPTCQYPNGVRSNRPNELCGSSCSNKEPYSDGNIYCNRHRKQIENKRTCQFVLGSRNKKAGEFCGSRINKEATPFDREENYEEHEYCGQYLCKRHTDQIIKFLDNPKPKQKTCSFTYPTTTTKHKKGEYCQNKIKEGNFCSHHHPDKINAKEQASKVKSKKSLNKATSDSEKEKTDDEHPDQNDESQVVSNVQERLEIDVHFPKTSNLPEWIAYNTIDQNKNPLIIFVDKKSGLVCYNPDNMNHKVINPTNLTALGQWNNEDQTWDELNADGKKYATNLKIPLAE